MALLRQERLGRVLGAAAVPAPTPRRQLTEVLASRQATLRKVAAVQLGARREDTQTRACLAARELQRWLSSLPAELGYTMETIDPAGVLWFTQEHWLRHHGGKPPAGSSRHPGVGCRHRPVPGRMAVPHRPTRVPLLTIAATPCPHRNAIAQRGRGLIAFRPELHAECPVHCLLAAGTPGRLRRGCRHWQPHHLP